MSAGRFAHIAQFALVALCVFLVSTQARANVMMQDKGIFVAGPFGVPDITKPPGDCAEAVFLAGSIAHAPLYLNELVVAGNGGQFSNNGWAGSSFFNVNIVDGGRSVWITWNLSGIPYALSYISVNFNNNFYHIYETTPARSSEGAIEVTGNQRDAISHIRFFGVGRVPDSGTTAAMLSFALLGLAFFSTALRVGRAN